MTIAPAAPEPTSSGFAYTRERFRELVETCLQRAKFLGASDAVAEGRGPGAQSGPVLRIRRGLGEGGICRAVEDRKSVV